MSACGPFVRVWTSELHCEISMLHPLVYFPEDAQIRAEHLAHGRLNPVWTFTDEPGLAFVSALLFADIYNGRIIMDV